MRFYWTIMSKNNIRIQKNSKFGVFIDKLSQSNFILWSPDCHLVRSYLIATVQISRHNSKKLLVCTSMTVATLRACSILALATS